MSWNKSPHTHRVIISIQTTIYFKETLLSSLSPPIGKGFEVGFQFVFVRLVRNQILALNSLIWQCIVDVLFDVIKERHIVMLKNGKLFALVLFNKRIPAIVLSNIWYYRSSSIFIFAGGFQDFKCVTTESSIDISVQFC